MALPRRGIKTQKQEGDVGSVQLSSAVMGLLAFLSMVSLTGSREATWTAFLDLKK